MEEERLCSRCGIRPRRHPKQRYCRECHAETQVGYRRRHGKKEAA